MRPIDPKTNITGAMACIGPGTRAAAIAMKPYRPPLDCTPLTTATAGGGRSVYVGGIQVCSGQTGVFTKNAKAIPAKIHSLQVAFAIQAPPGAGRPITSVV